MNKMKTKKKIVRVIATEEDFWNERLPNILLIVANLPNSKAKNILNDIYNDIKERIKSLESAEIAGGEK